MMNNKRKKSTRHRGTHTHSRGAKKKARGSGHRGGVGKSGSGKRGDQKKTSFLKKGKKYFRRDKVRKAAPKKKIKPITLKYIADNTTEKNLEFRDCKIIGDKIDKKVKITAFSASRGAIEAVKKAGGEIILFNRKHNSTNKKSDSEEQDGAESNNKKESSGKQVGTKSQNDNTKNAQEEE